MRLRVPDHETIRGADRQSTSDPACRIDQHLARPALEAVFLHEVTSRPSRETIASPGVVWKFELAGPLRRPPVLPAGLELRDFSVPDRGPAAWGQDRRRIGHEALAEAHAHVRRL